MADGTNLSNYNKLKDLYIKYLDYTTERYLEPIDYEIMLLRLASSYAHMYYTTNGRISNLRVMLYLLSSGSSGKGHIMKQEMDLLEDLDEIKGAKYNYRMNAGVVTDAELRGTFDERSEPVLGEDGNQVMSGKNVKYRKVKKFFPGSFELYHNLYFEEAADIFASNFFGEGRASNILNGCESDSITPGTANQNSYESEDGKDAVCLCNFSFFLSSIPNVSMSKDLLLKNVFGRFVCIYRESKSGVLKDNVYDSLDSEWVREDKVTVDEIKGKIQMYFRNVLSNEKWVKEKTKKYIHYSKEIVLYQKKVMKEDLEWEELLEGFERGQSWGDYEAAEGVIFRIMRNTMFKFATIICILNGDKSVNELHVLKANELCKRSFEHFINYFRSHISTSIISNKKNVTTDEDVNKLVLKVLKGYYTTRFMNTGKKITKGDFIELLREESINAVSKVLPRDRKNLAKRVAQMVEEKSILEIQGEGNTRHLVPASMLRSIGGTAL